MRIRVVIQSRLNSSRLPGKALLTMAGMPLIELVARRVSRSGHEVIVATSEEHYDNRIAEHLTSVGIPVVRGSLDDVLGRFVAATADLADDDLLVRMTGDNPVADADVIDELLGSMRAGGYVYGRNNIDLAPEGIGCEAWPVGLLRQADREATDPYDREHVTPWIRRAVDELDNVPKGAPSDIMRHRATVDCLDDYDVVSRAFDGVEDPIGIGWIEMLERVGRCRPGPMVPRAEPGLHGMAAVVLAVAPDEPIDGLRDRLRSAVSRGVSHVWAPTTAAELLRAAGDPAVRQRVAHLLQVPSGLDATAVSDAVLRAAIALNGQRLAGLIHPGIPDPRVWEQLSALRADGLIQRLGIQLDTPADIDRLPADHDDGWLVVDDAVAAALASRVELADRLGGMRILLTGVAPIPPYGIAARAVSTLA